MAYNHSSLALVKRAGTKAEDRAYEALWVAQLRKSCRPHCSEADQPSTERSQETYHSPHEALTRALDRDVSPSPH